MKTSSNLLSLFMKLNKLHAAIFRKLLDNRVTMPQYFILKQIHEEPKTIGDISKAIDLSYSTVSGIIDRLEREQLVERIRDRHDRRIVWIRATEKLDHYKQKTMERFQTEIYEGLDQVLSGEQIENTEKTLQTIITYLEKKVE